MKPDFAAPAEADIVDLLRNCRPEALSLVSVIGDQIVWYILFNPVVMEYPGKRVQREGLVLLAVLPEFQRLVTGYNLVQQGIKNQRKVSCPFIFVLGHPVYPPLFGFGAASRYGLKCQWDSVPDEAFIALILNQNVMEGVSGVVR